MLNFLGICRRAGKLECGLNRTVDAVKHQKAFVVVTACDLSEKSKKEARFFTNKFSCPLIETQFTVAQLTSAISFNAGVVAVTDRRLAEKLVSINKGEMQHGN